MRFLLILSLMLCAPFPAAAVNALDQGRGCEKRLLSLIDGAQSTIDAAVYAVNRESIVNALVKAHGRGIAVRLLTDRAQLAAVKDTSVIDRLTAAGIEVRAHTSKGLMHAKIAVFDGKSAISGSFNWTDSAVERNSEVCNLFIDAPDDAARHQQLFDKLWRQNSREKSDRWLKMRGRCGDIPLLRT